MTAVHHYLRWAPHCAARMGCHSPSPTVPSSLFASFPFLTEKEARGSPRNGNYRRNWSCETLGREQANWYRSEVGVGVGRADGCVGLEKHGLHNFFCSYCQQWSEWGMRRQQTGQHNSTTGTASQAKGGEATVLSPWPLGCFHLENGIKGGKVIGKEVQRSWRNDKHRRLNCFQMLTESGCTGSHWTQQWLSMSVGTALGRWSSLSWRCPQPSSSFSRGWF